MRTPSFAMTPFEKGKSAAKAKPDCINPYADGSVEHRNYELGRVFGTRHFKLGAQRRGVEPRV